MMVALDLFINRTRYGRGVRAVAQNPDTAALMGVNKDRVIMLIFMLGGVMAGAAALLCEHPDRQHPVHSVGFLLGLKAFTAAVLGGIGNLRGALLGGLLLGVVEVYAATLSGSNWEDVIAFVGAGRGADVPPDRPARRVAGEGTRMSDEIVRRRGGRGSSLRDAPWATGVSGAAASGSGCGAPGRRWSAFLYYLPLLGIPGLRTADRLRPRAATTGRGVLFTCAIYVLLAIGLNVVVGLAGLLDLGYVGFFAIGAYTVALFGSPNSPVRAVAPAERSTCRRTGRWPGRCLHPDRDRADA